MKLVLHHGNSSDSLGAIHQPIISGAVSAKALQRLLRSVILLILLASYPAQVNAQVTQPVNKVVPNRQNRLAELKFPRNGAPIGRRQGGARRTGTECPDLKTPMTALVPGEESADESKSFLAFTVSEYPTFWVYVPQLPSKVRSGEFVFQDDLGNDVYRMPLTLPEKSGAIGISLPQNPQYALKTNNKYQWYFKVYCGDRSNTSEYFYVKAWVQRVALTSELESQLKTAKPEEYNAYATNNIWQDAVTNLAELRRTNSASRVVAEDWANLLRAVGLEKFASASVVWRYGFER
ncbi:DUF928 domain-containing protein [Tolypothrix sp. VBCCA 56010]|uniref:DUF928 domain-containing protein n=1 Tax=Tolypothrix sp. VBCCA 56010 TaxID=3137731 RepID=UPI003D7D3050